MARAIAADKVTHVELVEDHDILNERTFSLEFREKMDSADSYFGKEPCRLHNPYRLKIDGSAAVATLTIPAHFHGLVTFPDGHVEHWENGKRIPQEGDR